MSGEHDDIHAGAVNATLADCVYSILKDYDKTTWKIVLDDVLKRLKTVMNIL